MSYFGRHPPHVSRSLKSSPPIKKRRNHGLFNTSGTEPLCPRNNECSRHNRDNSNNSNNNTIDNFFSNQINNFNSNNNNQDANPCNIPNSDYNERIHIPRPRENISFMERGRDNRSTTDSQRKIIAQETENILKRGTYRSPSGKTQDISKMITYCVQNTQTIRPDDLILNNINNNSNISNDHQCLFEVTNETTFSAAKRIKQTQNIRETCVLNFASAIKPGGGFLNGRQAQEECLARQSALYFSLKNQTEMYDYNRKRKGNSIYTDHMIYSPNVPVFRDDSDKLIENPYRVSIISSAAVNLSELKKKTTNNQENIDFSEIFNIMKTRCRKILFLSINKNNSAIVLGAFGCGVFGNRPEDISRIFKELLIDEGFSKYFKIVVFAIAGSSSSNNYITFQNTFRSVI